MNVVVTGAAGFIGSHLCDRLISDGHRVIGLDSLLLGNVANLRQLSGNRRFNFIQGDVADYEWLSTALGGVALDVIFHFAANSNISLSHDNPQIDFHNTFKTTWSVLELMRTREVRSLVFASTSAVYGETTQLLQEDAGARQPISHYGAGKLASEAFIASYVANYGLRAWIPRFPNVVGERATHGAILDFVNKLDATPGRLEVLGDGNQIKPYLHVQDLIDAVLLAWKSMEGALNVFNVAGDTRCTVRRMAEIVAEESGRPVELVFTGGDRGWIGDVPTVEYETSRISRLGWRPKLDSEDAIRVAAKWLLHGTRSR